MASRTKGTLVASLFLTTRAADCPCPAQISLFWSRGVILYRMLAEAGDSGRNRAEALIGGRVRAFTTPATPSAPAWAPAAAPMGGAHRRSRTCAAGTAPAAS